MARSPKSPAVKANPYKYMQGLGRLVKAAQLLQDDAKIGK
jgi:hypothetical protein